MALTLQDKFDRLHATEDAVRAALADLLDSSTGEAIMPGSPAFDVSSKQVFSNDNGKLVRTRPHIIQAPKVAS